MPPIDLIKRFAPTPFETTLDLVGGTRIRVASSSATLGEQLRRALPLSGGGAACPEEFILRVVVEPEDDLSSGSLTDCDALNQGDLSFFLIGRKSFLALDRRTQKGIGFVADNLVTDTHLLRRLFLPALNWIFYGQMAR